MAQSSNVSDTSNLDAIIQDVLKDLNIIQGKETKEDLLKKHLKDETKKELLLYLVEINQLIDQIEAFIERRGILESSRELLGSCQVKPKKILENLKEIRDQIELLLTLLDELKEFSSNCIAGLCEMLMQGVKIPKLEQFNISEISKVSLFTIFSEATTVISSKRLNEIVSCLENNAAIKYLILALSACFVWVSNIETHAFVGIGAGGLFLKAVYDESSRCFEKNEVFYKELGELESEILKCEIKAKLTTLLSSYEREVNNRKNAKLIIKIRDSFNHALTSIKGAAKSFNENKGKSDLEILEEMSANRSYDGLVEPVMQELPHCSMETAWKIMREILKKQNLSKQ